MEKDNNTVGDSIKNDFVKSDESNNNNNHESVAEVLEKGDIFFFYRPKAKVVNDGSRGDVKSIEDIRRFFMVTASTITAAATNTGSKYQEQFDNTNRTTSKEEGES